MVGTGLLIVNVAEFKPTLTDAVPAVATFAAGTMAVSCVEETNVVLNGEPFQLTTEVEVNVVPAVRFTVRMNWPLPAMIEFGLIAMPASTVCAVNADSTRTNGKRRFMD
jgi:hypothetical protein